MKENPYWIEGVSPERMAGKERNVEHLLQNETFRAVEVLQEGAELESSPESKGKDSYLKVAYGQEVEEKVGYVERSADLKERKRRAYEKFEASVRKALVPLSAALALSSVSAWAAESERELMSNAHQTSEQKIAKTPSNEFQEKDVFDEHSLLAQRSEKVPARILSSEELAVIKDMQQKVWEARNEWVSFLSRDKEGVYRVQTQELDKRGGHVHFEDDAEERTDKIIAHTHQMAEYVPRESLIEMYKQRRGLLIPPSATDLGQCLDEAAEVTQLVVDARGVWEYRCDKQHAFAQGRVEKVVLKGMEEIQSVYHLSDKEMDELFATLSPETFKQLDKHYPGIGKMGMLLLEQIAAANIRFAQGLLAYENAGRILRESSRNMPDETLASLVKAFIKLAEERGMYLSYKPFVAK